MSDGVRTGAAPVMAEMTVKTVRDYLSRSQSIIVPLGMIEQHGYHLPLSTDLVIAERTGRLLAERTGIMVAHAISQLFSGGGLPGTVNISPAIMSQVVTETLLALRAQGFRNFYVWACHGGSENMRALEDGLKVLLRCNPAFEDALIALLPAWRFGRADRGWQQAIREHDWHAGWLETAVMMDLAPELVRMDALELDAEPVLNSQIEHPDNYQHAEKIVDDEFVVPRMTQRPDIDVGVMGHPEKATPELGREIVEDVVSDASARILEIDAKADGTYREVQFVPPPVCL